MSSTGNPEKTYAQQATETFNNVKDAVANSMSGDKTTTTTTTTTQPTVASKLGDAFESLKDATGIAADNTAQKTEEGKAAAAVKKDETKEQVDAARSHAQVKTAEAGQGLDAAVKDARADLAARIQPKH